MAGRIKGIVIEVGGNTVGLQNALKDVNKRSKDLQKELKDVDKLLKFNPNSVELLAQRQQILTDSIQNTTRKLNDLKEAEREVQAQFERGDISEETYRGFRRELEQTEQSLQGCQNALQDMNTEQDAVARNTRRLETFFQAAGDSVEDYADVIGQRLARSIAQGTASSRDLETALQRIGRQALGASGDIGRLQTALDSVDDGNSIQNIRRDIQQLGNDADDAEGSVGDLGDALSGLAGAAVAGGGIAGVIEKSLSNADLNLKVDIGFDVPESSKKAIKNAITGIETYGIDSETALEGVRRQWALNVESSDAANSAVIKGAGAIASSYTGLDFNELIVEANEIAKTFGISNEEALGLTNTLLKTGFPPDQLDIISEYGSQLEMAGYNAGEVQALFAAGVDTKTWNIDNLMDGLKEGRIKLAEFGQGVPEAMDELLAKTGISKTQLETWGQAVAAGGEGGKKAMGEVAQALVGVKDETAKNQLGIAIFGTLYEEQGSNITDTLINAKDKTVDLKTNQDLLNDSVSKLDASPSVALKQAMSDLLIASQPLLIIIADLISKVADWVSKNPELAGTILAIITAVGILVGICMALAPIFITIAGLAAVLGVAIGAVAIPVLIVIAAIAAIIAIGVLLWKNWDTITQKAGELGSKVKIKFNEIKDNIVDKIKEAVSSVKEQIEKIKGFFSGLKLKLPHIKLPHFSLNGKFSLAPPSVPKLNIDWYKNGGVFPANSPRLVGMGDASVPEAAIPLSDKVLGTIAKMISERMDGGGSGIIIQNMTVREEADIQKISKELYRLTKTNARGKGVIMT